MFNAKDVVSNIGRSTKSFNPTTVHKRGCVRFSEGSGYGEEGEDDGKANHGEFLTYMRNANHAAMRQKKNTVYNTAEKVRLAIESLRSIMGQRGSP